MTRATPLPPGSVLRDMFRYSPEDGRLFWAKRRCGTKCGTECGHENASGYRRVKLNGRLFLSHRIIYAIAFGEDPGGYEVDHIDRNPRNNRPSNLRLATKGQNKANGLAYSRNNTGLRGVHKHRRTGKFLVTVQGRYVGCFKNIADATLAYDQAALRAFGEFARPNGLEQ